MNPSSAAALGLVLGLSLAGPGRAGQAQAGAREFTGSAAYGELLRAGRTVVAERAWDLDGDGRAEALVVEGGESELALSIYRDEGQGDFRRVFRSGTTRASELARLEQLRLGQTAALVFDVFEDNPDEAEHFVRLIALEPLGEPAEGQARIRPRTVFGGRYRVSHPEEDAGRTPVRVIDLGGLAVGLELGPATGPGWPALFLRSEARRVSLGVGPDGRETWVLVGLGEEEYRAEGGEYALAARRVLDFLPRLAATQAAGAQESGLALDGRPETGFRFGPEPATWAVDLGAERPLRALRVLSGCGDSDEEREKSGRVGWLELDPEGARPLRISLDPPGAGGDPRILAQGPPGAWQVLVLLAEPLPRKRLRLRLGVGQAGEGGGACLGELGLHAAWEAASRSSPPPP